MDKRTGIDVADEKTLHQIEGVNRIFDFATGIMGFAITLLVTGIRVPDPGRPDLLPSLLVSQWPQYIAYIVSFYIIGENWIIYSRIFSHIERYGERLYWLNLLYLFFIAIIPFPTRLVSAYPDRKIPALLYAGVITCVLFSRTLLWWYVTKNHRLVHKDLDPRLIHGALRTAILLLAGFGISAVIALISPIDAIYVWVVLAVVGLIARMKLYRPLRR